MQPDIPCPQSTTLSPVLVLSSSPVYYSLTSLSALPCVPPYDWRCPPYWVTLSTPSRDANSFTPCVCHRKIRASWMKEGQTNFICLFSPILPCVPPYNWRCPPYWVTLSTPSRDANSFTPCVCHRKIRASWMKEGQTNFICLFFCKGTNWSHSKVRDDLKPSVWLQNIITSPEAQIENARQTIENMLSFIEIFQAVQKWNSNSRAHLNFRKLAIWCTTSVMRPAQVSNVHILPRFFRICL